MLRRWQWVLLLSLVALVAIAAAGYWVLTRRAPLPTDDTPATPLAGLDSLPAEAGLVARIDLAAIRQQEWFLSVLEQATAEAGVEEDYKAFVASTGFDYTRDLDQLWLGLFGSGDRPFAVGIAEGRFSREKILAHARAYNGRQERFNGYEIYQVDDPIRSDAEGAGSFAFAFLADDRLAFGTDAERVRMVIETASGQRPAIGSDPGRRARLEKLGAGQQAWAVDDLSRWVPEFLRSQEDIDGLLKELAAGVFLSPDGLRLRALAHCHEPEQAQSLHDNLKLYLLMGRLLLGRNPNAMVKSLAGSLGDVAVYQEGTDVQAELTLTPEQITNLVAPPEEAAKTAPQ